jgi:hypothetical protein
LDSASSSSARPIAGVELADLDLVAVAHAAGHRAGGHEHRRQVAEVQRADQQARHDLVAHAQVQRGVEHVVRQRDGGRHGDGVAREQRHLHAGWPWVTPSHMAGVPPANCATAPASRAASLMIWGKRSNGWCADSMSL